MKPVIVLFVANGGWMADFRNDQEVQKLFGTTIIPTPFTDKTERVTVVREIEKRNPNHDVVLMWPQEAQR